MKTPGRSIVLVLLVVVLALLGAGCSTGDSGSSDTTADSSGTAKADSTEEKGDSDSKSEDNKKDDPEAKSEDESQGDSKGDSTGAFPVTIKHVFGETTIEKQPTRVATVSWVNSEVVAALGVVPVGMSTDNWGANENGSTDYKDAKLAELGAAHGSDNYPTQFNDAEGLNFQEIALVEPDIILAVYSGITQEDYDKLSEIAPTIAYPEHAWGTAWDNATEIIGKALGKTEEANTVIADVKQYVADKVAEHPEIKGKTFIAANLSASTGTVSMYAPHDNRPRFFAMLGLELAPVAVEAAKDAQGFYVEWSPERASELESDILHTWVTDKAEIDVIKDSDVFNQIPAIKRGSALLDPNNQAVISISAASPLSIPTAVDHYLPLIVEALNKTK